MSNSRIAILDFAIESCHFHRVIRVPGSGR